MSNYFRSDYTQQLRLVLANAVHALSRGGAQTQTAGAQRATLLAGSRRVAQ